MTQDFDRWAIADEFERQTILKALAMAIAAMDLGPSGQGGVDRKAMAQLLTRLANDKELELYENYARRFILGIADSRAGLTKSE